jgi:hypothetical protein
VWKEATEKLSGLTQEYIRILPRPKHVFRVAQMEGISMERSEEDVFNHVVEYLCDHDYRFLVHCNYESVLESYSRHSNILIPPDSIPDIIGLTPEGLVFAVEVKGDRDIKKGRGQALTNLNGVHLSFLAADEEAIRPHRPNLLAEIGVIGVSEDGTVEWNRPADQNIPGPLPDIRSQLRYQLREQDSIGEITKLNLAHPANFLAPLILAEKYESKWVSRSYDALRDEIINATPLNGRSADEALKGARVLKLISGKDQVLVTEEGKIGIDVLQSNEISTIEEINRFKRNTRKSQSMVDISPSVSIWLRDQFRKHPEFEVLYRVIQDFEAETPIPLTDVCDVLLREYPNTFLNLFCTNKSTSRSKARRLIKQMEKEKIVTDIDTFREILNQNIIQNFTRQLIHIGVLSSRTSSTNISKSEYDPDEFPWYPASRPRTTSL